MTWWEWWAGGCLGTWEREVSQGLSRLQADVAFVKLAVGQIGDVLQRNAVARYDCRRSKTQRARRPRSRRPAQRRRTR